ncbi:MAG TPA: nitroreductase family deazaflavin-dependent oxidoreductase [Anaerolineales bacterium]|nr:nitroreductase family deazaflavin-dependent oxidoreductase [Anaerolineales bacterium]
MDLTPKPRWWHPIIQKLAASLFGIWLLATRLDRLDIPILRLTGNRTTLTTLLSGLPTILLTATGAKSGQPRTVPLVAIPDGENLILVASNFGNARHPAWYYNLRAHPRATVASGGQTWRVTARLLEGEERERCWAKAVGSYPGYQVYKEKASERVIPVFLLEPTAA